MQVRKKINSLVQLDEARQLIQGQRIVNKKYTILHKIADQPTSKVYSLSTRKHNKQVIRAIKMVQQQIISLQQSQSVGFPQISKQVSVLKKLFQLNECQIGFPKMFQYGVNQGQNYMITKLLGPNLGQLHRLCNFRFSIPTCLLVGLQMLDRIQKIHQLGYTYRDIRLQNFVLGLGHQSSLIHMVDFGHCQKFRDKQTGNHIPYREGNSNIQDMTFMSVNIHNNVHYSRRDDIQSLLYLIFYMYKSKLPWRKVEAKNKKEKDQKVADIKKAITPSYLSNNFGIEMSDVFWYTRSVNFYQKPDYDFIRYKLHYMLLQKSQIKTNIQIKYDWNDRQQMDYTVFIGEPKLFLNKNQSKDQDGEKSDQDNVSIQKPMETKDQHQRNSLI